MIIKINNFSPISYHKKSLIVSNYFKQFETSKLTNNGLFGSLKEEFTVKENPKYPVIISLGSSNYHVRMRKTKTTYVFDVWLAP